MEMHGAVCFRYGWKMNQYIVAVTALSEAFNQSAIDDVFTKLSFQLTCPGTPPATPTDAAVVTTTASSTPVQTTAKSPFSSMTVLVGIGMAGFFVMILRRK
jgi:hypothetical protein